MAKNAYSIPKIIIRNCKEYFKKARGWGLLEQGVAVLRALFWTASIVATNNLFDALTSASNPTFNGLASKTLILGAVLITQQILSGSGQYLLSKVSYSNMGKFMVDFQKKLGRVPAVKFEESDFLNSVNKAKECLEYESLGHFASTCLQLFTYYSVYILSVGGYLFYVSPILPVIILIAFVPSVIGQLTHVKVLVELEKNNAPLRRENEYYKKTIVGKSYFMETRMLGGFSYLRNLFMLSLIQITDKTWKTERKMALVQLMLSLTTFIGLGVSILLLLNLTMTGAIGVGAFVSVFIALSQIFSIMEEVVAAVVGNGIATIVQVTNFYRLMDMTEVTGTETKPDFGLGIAASNIKFAYPGTEHFALRDVSLSIKPGETIAIVGENGSGKSTLVRHLIGLYTPQSGSVKIGGVDSSNTLPKSLYGQTSAVFQKFQRYKMTLSENITMSDIDKPVNDARIHAVIKDAEFNETKARLDTMLSPEFGGIDLSGGQWQRLAIARGLYRPNEFIVLDEPSASIDPLEETRLFKHFKAIAKNKCALIVTHRLGSVKLADRIVVMDGGSIAEIGTHDALLENKGKYAEMWHKQMHWYVDDI